MENNKQELYEFNLSRLKTHLDNKRPFAILTGFRSEYDTKTNRERNQKIKHELRNKNFGFVPVKGGYVENDEDGKPVEVKEESLLVIGNIGDGDVLKKVVTKLGKKFEQDSILFRDDDGETMLISTRADGRVGPIGAVIKLGKWSPNKMSEYFTELKNGSRFMFEAVEDMDWKKPSGFAEYMAISINRKNFLKD